MDNYADTIWPDAGPGPEWYRELADADAPIPLWPARCAPIVADITDTLGCTHRWTWHPGTGWLHETEEGNT